MYVDLGVLYARSLSERCAVLYMADGEALRQFDRPNLEAEIAANGGRIVAFRQKSRLDKVKALAALVLRTLAFRPDVVHAQEHPEPYFVLALEILSRFVPVVVTVHDPAPHSGRDGDYARRRAPYIQRTRRIAKVAVVHGDYCRSSMLQQDGFDADRVFTIPLATCLIPEAGEQHEATPGAILFFGRMESYKGLDVLLDALRELRRRGVDFEIRLAGRGAELDRLKVDYEALGAAVIKDYFISTSEAIDELQKAWLVVVPYKDATQSGVVCAAFANNAPVVATLTGGLGDYVVEGENGLLVPPSAPLPLADALEKVLTDPALRSRLSEGAARTAATLTNWEICAAQCMQLYAAVAQAARQAGSKP